MFGEEHGEEEAPDLDVPRCSGRAETVAAEEVDECRGSQTSKPGEKSQGIEPGTNGVTSPWYRALRAEGDLGGIAAELDPIVDKKGAACEGPDDGEQR